MVSFQWCRSLTVDSGCHPREGDALESAAGKVFGK